jgi:hypothetical protein
METAPITPEEKARRKTDTQKVLAFVTANEFRWIPAEEFEQFARQAWRTRISDARKIVKREGGELVNRCRRPGGKVVSEYRYRSQPLGRDAADHVEKRKPVQLSLFGALR